MTDAGLIAANLGSAAVFVGGIVLCVRFDQRGKTARRKLEHRERMRAIKAGVPLDDAAVARAKALGAIGVAAPIVSLSAAVVGTCFAALLEDGAGRLLLLAVIWVACGAVALAPLPRVLAWLREPPGTGVTAVANSPETRG